MLYLFNRWLPFRKQLHYYDNPSVESFRGPPLIGSHFRSPTATTTSSTGERRVQMQLTPGSPVDGNFKGSSFINSHLQSPTTLEKWLLQTVAEGTDIYTTVDTKHTKWVEPESFPGEVATFAGIKEEGAMTAKKHTDGSGEIYF